MRCVDYVQMSASFVLTWVILSFSSPDPQSRACPLTLECLSPYLSQLYSP